MSIAVYVIASVLYLLASSKARITLLRIMLPGRRWAGEVFKKANTYSRLVAMEPYTVPALFNLFYGEDMVIGPEYLIE